MRVPHAQAILQTNPPLCVYNPHPKAAKVSRGYKTAAAAVECARSVYARQDPSTAVQANCDLCEKDISE